jgi:hypothetical protein
MVLFGVVSFNVNIIIIFYTAYTYEFNTKSILGKYIQGYTQRRQQ